MKTIFNQEDQVVNGVQVNVDANYAYLQDIADNHNTIDGLLGLIKDMNASVVIVFRGSNQSAIVSVAKQNGNDVDAKTFEEANLWDSLYLAICWYSSK